MKKILLVLLLLSTSTFAQDLTNHAVAIGGGAGFSGFRAAGPCGTGQALVWGSSTVDPTCAGVPVIVPSGAKCDGITNDSVTINAAITTANAAGGGKVILPAGTCIASALALRSLVVIQGAGRGITIVKLPNAANVDVFFGVDSYSLFGGTSNAGIYDWGISDLTIDGNSANNSSGNGIAVYGYRYNLENLVIQNTAVNFIHSEWGSGGEPAVGSGMEAHLKNILGNTTGQHGFNFLGPHDSNFDSVIAIDAGQSTNNTYYGMYFGALMNARVWGFHGWHTSAAPNRTFAQFLTDGSGSDFSESHFEGSFTAPMVIGPTATQNNFNASNKYYSTWNGGSQIIVHGAENTIKGLMMFFSARASAAGITLGQGGDNASYNNIDLISHENRLGAVDFTNSAGNNRVKITGFATTGPGYIATPPVTDTVDLYVPGAASLQRINQMNSWAVTGSSVPTIGANASVANALSFYTRGAESMRIDSQASPVNFLDITAAAAAGAPAFSVVGSDTNINLAFSSKGTGAFTFSTNAFGSSQFFITHTAGATRNLGVTGSNGGNPVLSSTAGGINLAPSNGHVPITGGSAPTLTAGCNGAGSVVTGTDAAGTITGQTAAATTCTLTFGTAYSATPHCVAAGQTSPLTGAFTPSTGTIVVNFGSTANYKWSYTCFGT